MSETPQANAYLRTKVMSASPAELRLMLLDGALKFATQARDGLQDANHEAIFSGFSQCRAIVLELLTTIDPGPNPELAENVKALYSFMYSELVEASIARDAARATKVIELLEYERETWALLMKQMASEQGEQRSKADTTAASNTAGADTKPAKAPMPVPAQGPARAPARAPAGYGSTGGGGGLSLSA
ncbi:MAG: flagellar export chaperone FliS [Planctomycetota bacterium]